jgi:hypothetical protein
MPLLRNHIINSSPREDGRGALTVASTMASQFASQPLNDEPNSGSDWSRTSLFPWALLYGQEAVVQLLVEGGFDTEGKCEGVA